MTTSILPTTQPEPSGRPDHEVDPRNPRLRLLSLLDPASYREISVLDHGGFLAVTGTVLGTEVVCYASDPTVQGGTMGADGCDVVVRAYELALARHCPIIGLYHSGGARLQEGVGSLHGVGRVFQAMIGASGKIPQISVVLGAAAGGAAYGPALTDVVILAKEGRIFVTGPDVIRSVTGEDVDMARLGGPEPHSRKSGVAHLVADTEADALLRARELAALLSDQRAVDLSSVEERELASVLPESDRRAYDVHPLVDGILDTPGLELHPRWAPNVVTTLGRLGGATVGVVANNPLRLGGCLDATAAEKAARFVRMCDAFGVPLVVVVDVPGYLPGLTQEWEGVVRRGAKLLHAFGECVVARVTLVTRKAYGGAYIAMNARSLGAMTVLAWPNARVAVMGSVAAVRILHRRALAEVPAEFRPQLELELAKEYDRISGDLTTAVEMGVVDRVVPPGATRSAIAAAIADAPRRRGNHGNIPL